MTTVLERPTTAGDAPVVDKRVVRRRLGPGRRIPFSLAIRPILLVGLWWLLSATGGLDPRTLSEPWVVLETARDLIESGRLQDALQTSAVRAFAGLGLGTLIGTTLALVSGLSRVGEAVIDGPVQVKRRSPTLALLPLLVLWLGICEEMKIIAVALAVISRSTSTPTTSSAASTAGTPTWRRPSASAARTHPRGGAAGRDAGLPARHALRGHPRAAVAGRGRADQLDPASAT